MRKNSHWVEIIIEELKCEKLLQSRNNNNTGLQRNWGKYKNIRSYLIWGAEFKFEIRFYFSPLVF